MSQDNLSIPIPSYPPFTLRSSLIDKDPVIWVHLLEGYIRLFQYLIEDNFKFLTVKSKQQLYQFLKCYLFETFDEESKIFSLGAVNPDIRHNEQELKHLVFQFIKTYSIVKLNLIGESIWYFIGIFVNKNNSVVRGLVDGSFKSKLNDNKKSGKISSISSVQKYLQQKISKRDFTDKDLNILSMLLGQSISSKTKINLNDGHQNKTINKKKSIDFAEKFVTKDWIQILEGLYNNGKNIHATTAKNIMIVSLISLPASQIAKLLKELNIDNTSSMILSPLFCSIIISSQFLELVPGLEEKISFLTVNMEVTPKEEDMDTLIAILPDIPREKAKILLQDNNNDVEKVTNMLLENPGIIDDIEVIEEKDESSPKHFPKTRIDKNSTNRFNSDNLSFTKLSKKSKNQELDYDKSLKERTMVNALRMMYDSDEDEPDDTYDQQEVTTGDDKETSRIAPAFDPKEEYLFALFKKNGMDQFEKTSRKTSGRQRMRKDTGWSDEQIEGWIKMLLKSRRRFKMMEENYLYGKGNPNRASTSSTTSDTDTKETQESALKSGERSGNKERANGKQDFKMEPEANGNGKKNHDKSKVKSTYAYNDKNKAKKANHNRKQGHNKKANHELKGAQL